MKQKVYIILMLVGIVGASFVVPVIFNYRKKVNNLKTELNDTNDVLNDLEVEYNKTLDKLTHYKNRTKELKAQKSKLNKSIENLRESEYTFHLPTPQKVRDIVEETDIDKRKYTEDYDCTEYSFGLIEKLKDRGILSYSVELNFEEGKSHVLIATNTTKGIKYIEPENDAILSKMKISDDYCDLVDWECEEPWKISKISSCYGILKVSE